MNSTLYPFSNDEYANKRRYDMDFDTVGKLLYLVNFKRGRPDFNEYVKLLSDIREHERAMMRNESRPAYIVKRFLSNMFWNNLRRMEFLLIASLIALTVHVIYVADDMLTFVLGLALFCYWFVKMFVRFGSE